MKDKSRKAVSNLIGTLGLLLGIYVVIGIIVVIVLAVLKSPDWWVVMLIMLPVAIILGVLLLQLSNAFDSIIEDMEEIQVQDEAISKISSFKKQSRKQNRIKSKPSINVMSDDFNAFCDNVCVALDNASVSEQVDWLEYWRDELQNFYDSETDSKKKKLYAEQINYIDLSISALEN